VWSPYVGEESVQAGLLKPSEPTGGSDEIEAARRGVHRDSFPGSPLGRVGLELKPESDLACSVTRVFCRLRRRRHTKRGLIAYVRRA
jgi:hypothetical protein